MTGPDLGEQSTRQPTQSRDLMTVMSNANQRALRGLQLTYFARFGAYSFLLLYVNLFFKRQGLSGTEIGTMGTIGAVSALLAAPVWGRLSDRVGRPRRLLQVAMVVSSLAIFLLGHQTVFGWMALFTSLNGMAQAAMDPLSDSMTISLTRGERYGSIRLWGSLGWAAFVLIAGWMIEHIGLPVMFVGYIILIAAAAIVLLMVPHDVDGPLQRQKPRLQDALKGLIASPPMLWLLVALALQQLSFVAILVFEPVYLDDLGAGATLIGLGFTVAALLEVPAMLWADRHLKMRGGGGLLRLGMLMGVLRAATVVLFPIVPVIVGGRFIEGIGYAFRQVSTVVLVTRSAPSGQNTTMLALYTTTLNCLMQVIVAPLAGLVYDTVGAYWLYAFAVVAQVVSIAILWLAFPPHSETANAGDSAI